ncbi:cytochrome P450 [Mycena sanguinolenta]|nr:cytochrome P450 [Mycena sanguinolenta]
MHSLALLVLAAVALRVLHKTFRAWQRLPLPPGPPPYALIGNFLDLPTKLPWLTYTKWGRQYGDLVHVSAPGQHIVVVNSVKTAVELFEKRSHIYSDRPVSTMVQLMGWDFPLGTLSRGDKWRAYRRMFQQHFRQDVVRSYRPIQMEKIHQLLQGLLSSPEEFREHLKMRAISYLVSGSNYHGNEYEVQPTNVHFVALSENAMKKLSDSIFPGAVAVDTFPILRYSPLGCREPVSNDLLRARQLTKEMQEVPVNFVKRNMRDGMDSTSVVAKLLATNRYDDSVAIQSVAGTAYAGGADTVQKKAQAEIDTVIGAGRLPEFEDRPSLPFVEALYREVMRWKPGYESMTHNESIYHEPDRFNPHRFFTADGKLDEDDTILAFGFGRRICAGRHHADATIWATIVSVLSTFNIVKAKDATGKEIDIDPKCSDGLISHPEPFACSITPRSEMAKTLVQATAETHDV